MSLRARVAFFALTLLVVACGRAETGAQPPDGDAQVETGTAEPAEGAVMTLEGTLGGDAQLEGGCVWLDTDSGRYEVMWPDGYRAEPDPVRLVGPDGTTVARDGDRLRVEGAVAQDMMSICQVGTIFSATSLEVR